MGYVREMGNDKMQQLMKEMQSDQVKRYTSGYFDMDENTRN